MRRALTGTAAAVLALAGCGGAEERSKPTSFAEGVRPLPACAKAPPPVSTESLLPPSFPLPPGTRITSSQALNESQFLIGGVIPADLQVAATFFNDMLPERGYQVGIGDAEATEAEAPFTGHGFRGRWRVNEIPDCPALTFTLVLIEQS